MRLGRWRVLPPPRVPLLPLHHRRLRQARTCGTIPLALEPLTNQQRMTRSDAAE